MYPDGDDFETFERNQLAADDLYQDDDSDWDIDLASDAAPNPVVAKAVALLAADGIEASEEIDCDADDDGRPRSWHCLHVACHEGCGPVAHVHSDSLADSLDCRAPEGAESACEQAMSALEKAGAFWSGWAS